MNVAFAAGVAAFFVLVAVLRFTEWRNSDESDPESDSCGGHHFPDNGYPPAAGVHEFQLVEKHPSALKTYYDLRQRVKYTCEHNGCYESKTQWETVAQFKGNTDEDTLPPHLHDLVKTD